MNREHMSEEAIYEFILNKGIYFRDIESLICAVQNYDPMLDVTYFIGEAYLRFTKPSKIKKIRNELVLSKAFHNFVVDIYRREFSTWKVRKVENINTIFSDQERKFMDRVGFTTNEKYLYAYITERSTCFRLGLKFLRGKDGKICKFKLCKHLKVLLKKIEEKTEFSFYKKSLFLDNEAIFLSYSLYGSKFNIDFIKKDGKISRSLLTSYFKSVSKKVFTYIEKGVIK